MSCSRTRLGRRPARSFALMMTASVLSLVAAGEAQAQCTPAPLNNVPANTVVTCSGTVAGPAIVLNGPNSTVLVDPGTTITNGSVLLNDSNNALQVAGTAGNRITLTDFSVASSSGPGNRQVLLSATDATNFTASVLGDSARLTIINGSTITTPAGGIFIGGGSTQATRAVLTLLQGSSITAVGPANGQALIEGGGQVDLIMGNSTLTTASDNLLIDLGNGDDFVSLTGMTLNGGSAGSLFLEGGFGNDELLINAGTTSRSYDLVVTGFESATLQSAAGQRLTLTGTADYATVFIAGGIVRVDAIEALGLNTATVATFAGSTLEINETALATLNHSFTGDGTIHQIGGALIYNGNSANFSGQFILDFNRAILGNGAALGTATITNNSLLFFGDFTLANSIGGTGQVAKFGTGTGVLTGNNTFSGGLTVSQGTLLAMGVGSLGTGTIAGANDTILRIDAGTNQVLANDITSQLALVKEGAGILDLTGNNSYSGGTTIDGGAIRVDDLARLGTGPVVANANGSLILDYNGAVALQLTTPFLTGAGQFVKEGTGELEVGGANGWTGGTTIREGTLRLASGLGLGTGDIRVETGAVLALGNAASSPTVANDISGGGSIVIDTVGGAELQGDNSGFTGAIRLTSPNAYLYVERGESLGVGSVNLIGSGTLLQFNAVANTVAAASLSGAGTFEKSGSGTLTLTGTGSLTGLTDIQAGTLRVAGGGNIGSGNIAIAGGATLDLDSAGATTLANALSGQGNVTKHGAGTVTLTGTNTHSGGIDIQAGAIRVNGSGAIGTGPVTVASGAQFIFDSSANATFASTISGAGTLSKQGAGTLTFSNPFAIGALIVGGGRARINTVATTNATVAAGGTLDGTGRIVGNLVNNGIVAPGNSIGTLTVQGNYVHNSGAVLEIEFDGAGGIDLLNVTGTATLNGGILRFVSVGGAEGSGGTFLTATGGVTGTFATVETVGAQLPLAVIYQPNSAIMAPSVLTARPSTFNAQSFAAADTVFGFVDAIADAPRAGQGRRLWLQGFAADGNRSASGTTLSYGHRSHGVSGGLILPVGGGWSVGAAMGWAGGEIDLGSNGGGGEQDSLIGAVQLHYSGEEGLAVAAGLVAGKVDQQTTRNVSFNNFAATVTGDTRSSLIGGYLAVDIRLARGGGWDFGMSGRASLVRQSQDGYTENGTSPLRLAVGEIETTAIEGRAGLSAKRSFTDGVDLRFDLGARYLGATGDRTIPVTFAASNAVIVLQGDTRDGLHGYAAARLGYRLSERATISVGYSGQLGQTDRHEGRIGLSIGF